MIRYRETQKIHRLAVFGIGLFVVFFETSALPILFHAIGDAPGARPDLPFLLVAALAGPLVIVSSLFVQLIIEVRDDGIYYRFFPFGWGFQRLSFVDIETMEIVSYSPLRDFGGWGKRYRFWGKFKGTCYTIGGDRALAVTKTDGKRIFLGTRRPDELLAAVYGAAGAR